MEIFETHRYLILTGYWVDRLVGRATERLDGEYGNRGPIVFGLFCLSQSSRSWEESGMPIFVKNKSKVFEINDNCHSIFFQHFSFMYC